MTFNTVSKRYQGTGVLKSDCKQPLRIGIIRALNECTGRLFRAATRHNHKSSDMQSKKISKLLEHIVCSNIKAHLDEHKLLSDRQHAFRKRHSCETQLMTVINDWAKILDDGGQVDTFILDFENAFDTPPHELIKCKLYGYGIGGKTLRWIDSFLFFRQQRVVVNGIKSDWAPVLSGVSQGTVLGPLLFSLYTNDITTDIDSEIRLFADDCVCYREIKGTEDTVKLQADIDRFGSWARKWGMRFQPVKCNIMQITRKQIKKNNASYN